MGIPRTLRLGTSSGMDAYNGTSPLCAIMIVAFSVGLGRTALFFFFALLCSALTWFLWHHHFAWQGIIAFLCCLSSSSRAALSFSFSRLSFTSASGVAMIVHFQQRFVFPHPPQHNIKQRHRVERKMYQFYITLSSLSSLLLLLFVISPRLLRFGPASHVVVGFIHKLLQCFWYDSALRTLATDSRRPAPTTQSCKPAWHVFGCYSRSLMMPAAVHLRRGRFLSNCVLPLVNCISQQ